MKITIVGTGYVGLVSGVCFSDLGNDVVCVDNNPDKIATLRAGDIPIFEPGLAELIRKNTAAGRLSFETDLGAAMADADAVFIAVGTPPREDNGQADLSHVEAVAREIGQALSGRAVVVAKSTVPVGTNRRVRKIIEATNPDAEFDVASNPEFLREGMAIPDFLAPDRIVVGVENERAGAVMRKIYKPLTDKGHPLLLMDIESAELTKYAANAFLAAKITFINEMAALCERVGADVSKVSEGMGLDARIGSKFLNAGPGIGGSCFPKDTSALAHIGQSNDVPMQITETVIRVNNEIKLRMVDKIRSLVDGEFSGKIITVLGVTFKPNTDDMREAPALTIVPALVNGGAKVRIVDPQGRAEGEKLLPAVEWFEDAYAACQNADAVVILTEWDEFRALDLKRLAAAMRRAKMADLRNIYSLAEATQGGFEAYVPVGRRGIGS